MVNLLETHVALELFVDQSVDLVRRDLALDEQLNLSLDVLVIDVGLLSYVQVVCVMHYHARRPHKQFLVLLPFESHLHRTIQTAVVFEGQTLVYLPSEGFDLSFGAYQSEANHDSSFISFAVPDFELDLVPLAEVIVDEERIIFRLEFAREGT